MPVIITTRTMMDHMVVLITGMVIGGMLISR